MSKLVRNRITEIIRKDGKTPEWTMLKDDDEIHDALVEKMGEERREYAESGAKEEIVDMFEVLRSIAHHQNMSVEEIICWAAKKREERGGFSSGLVLHGVEE